jgi:hypothetical protein
MALFVLINKRFFVLLFQQDDSCDRKGNVHESQWSSKAKGGSLGILQEYVVIFWLKAECRH